MANAEIGIIGGSGLYHIEGMEQVQEIKVDTPFGDPSDAYITGTLEGRKVAFLPRHGKGHRITPSELNFRANIYGFKKLGVKWIISVSAVGSLREDIEPRHIVLPNQFFDRTKFRKDTFFGDGVVGHVSFADPVCKQLGDLIAEIAKQAGAVVHHGGTYVNMEGPAFSTRAESNFFRQCGFDIIGMTNMAEAKLAREAEICYVTMAMVTDYDVWHEEEDDVSVETIIAILNENAVLAKQIIKKAITKIPAGQKCECAQALATAIITDRTKIPDETKQKLDLIIGKYL
jgi:5'-methylthioadenosine phosphorylase